MSYKVYISNNREYFVFNKNGKVKKIDFELSQSLLELLYIDIWKYEEYFRDYDSFAVNLNKIKALHPYFELYNSIDIKSLTKEQITHIPSNVQTIQDGVIDLLKDVLNVMSDNINIQTKLVNYYSNNKPFIIPFQFENITTSFEKIDNNTFCEVLYPKNIYEIIEYFVRYLIKSEQPFKLCKSCGMLFSVTGHASSEYCNRLFKDTNKTCKEIGAIKVYQAKVAENPAIKAYNKAYKTQFARIKYKRITKEEFNNWAELARSFRDKVLDGKMELSEFIDWLK